MLMNEQIFSHGRLLLKDKIQIVFIYNQKKIVKEI